MRALAFGLAATASVALSLSSARPAHADPFGADAVDEGSTEPTPVVARPAPRPAPTPLCVGPCSQFGEQHSKLEMGIGITLTTIGGISLSLVPFALYAKGLSSIGRMFDNVPGSRAASEPPPDRSGDVVLPALIGVGLGGLAVGIPLIVDGARHVPAGHTTASLPAWAGTPGGSGWRWKF